MPTNREELDRVLDEALEMTFPASDPVAVAAPGSTSRKTDTPAKPSEPARKGEKRDRGRGGRNG